MKTNLIRIVLRLVSAYFKRVNNLIQLAGLEARLAVKTLLNIILLCFVMFIILISAWLSLLSLLFLYLVSLHFSLVFSASMLVLLNILLMAIIVIAILKMKKNLFFPATRRHIHFAPSELQEIENE